MERWLGKTRVLLVLCGVLLLAAWNRQDPMVHAMAMVLVALTALAWVLPWLSLRGVAADWPRGLQDAERTEGQPLALGLQLHQRGWWPACVVEVEADWVCSGRAHGARATVPLLWPGRRVELLRTLAFDCRGIYRLRGVHLRSGFPLGLVTVQRAVPAPACEVRVLPRPWPVRLPFDWSLADDLLGEQARRHRGESTELHMLRPHAPGEPVHRVDWRASARAGDLVEQQFLHPAAVRVQLWLPLPGPAEVGDGAGEAEQTVRVAAGACAALAEQGLRWSLPLPGAPVARELPSALRVLAAASADAVPWPERLRAALAPLRPGEQLLAVVPPSCEADPLVQAARRARRAQAGLRVLVATWPGMPQAGNAQALALVEALRSEKVQAWTASA